MLWDNLLESEKPGEFPLHVDLLKALIDSMVDGVIVICADSKIRLVNPACEKIFGYTAQEMLGRPVTMLMSDEIAAEHDNYVQNYLRTGQAKVIGIGRETVGRHKSGRALPIDLSVGEVKHGENACFVGILRDISERKRLETEVSDFMDRLKQSNEDLNDFTNIISHDLKQPLRGIMGYAHYLLQDYASTLNEDATSKLQSILRLSAGFGEMLDSLLDYSRMGSEAFSNGLHSMTDIAEKARSFFAPAIEEGALRIDIAPDMPRMYCDSARIRQVFINLFANAIKYNNAPVKIIEAGCLPEGKDGTKGPVFYVRDNGIGIQPKFHDCIFRIFKRLHGKDEYGGGTGSGLAIVKKIIERGKGRVWVESDGATGTTFLFTLKDGAEPARACTRPTP